MKNRFQVISPFQPQGDQPQAIDKLTANLSAGQPFQTLLGATGTGKTFTMAHTIARLNRPTLVISHNKTLAAQLYEEFKDLFPNNAVGYFVSYYDYYQPEAYIPQRDIYIEKDASRNDDLDRLRLSATSNLVSRRDVLLVASVSCIFGLGSPESYKTSVFPIRKDVETDRDEMLRKLIDLQYSRNDIDFKRSTFRVRGDVVEVHPSYEEFAYRIEFFGDQVERLTRFDPLTGGTQQSMEAVTIYPGKQFVTPSDKLKRAILTIREELDERLSVLNQQQASVSVSYNGATSRGEGIQIAARAPRLYPFIFNQDGSTNSAGNPAAAGSIVVLFATGLGVTSPPSVTGKAAVAPYPGPASPVRVLIDGQDGTILFAGLAPGTAGVMQVNVGLPAGIAANPAADVILTLGTARTQAGVPLAVR